MLKISWKITISLKQCSVALWKFPQFGKQNEKLSVQGSHNDLNSQILRILKYFRPFGTNQPDKKDIQLIGPNWIARQSFEIAKTKQSPLSLTKNEEIG